MPSQQELRWSQLRVGITVIFSCVVLAVLIFLMSGTSGIFTKKLTIRAYFQSTNGLRIGAPVTFQGVTVGNVRNIRIVPTHMPKPVEVVMRIASDESVAAIRKDSVAGLTSAGVLGDLFVDISSENTKGAQVQNGDELQSEGATSIEDVVKAGQGTLQNLDALMGRMDRILAAVEEGKGSVGMILKDPSLYNRANALLGQMQNLIDGISKEIGRASCRERVYVLV